MIQFVWFICLCMAFLMFRTKDRVVKFSLLFITVMLFSVVELTFLPIFRSANQFMFYCFFFSEYSMWKKIYLAIKKSNVFKVYLLLLFFGIFSIVVSPHVYSSLFEIFKYVKDYFFYVYLAIVVAFISIRNDSDVERVLRFIFPAVCVFFVIGVINQQLGTSVYLNYVSSKSTLNGDSLGDQYLAYSERFRVMGSFSLACTYGQFNLSLFLLYLYGMIKKIIPNWMALIVFVGSLWGIYVSGFRACLLTLAISIVVFWYVCYGIARGLKYLLVFLVLFCVSYFFIPVVNIAVNNTLTVFTDYDGSHFSGSSIDMRIEQFLAVMDLIRERPLTGNGVGFFYTDLGWADGGGETLLVRELQGLESVILSYLLERGIIGLILYLVMLFTIFKHFWIKRCTGDELSAIGVSVLVSYFVFAVTTGEQGTFYFTFLILGMLMGAQTHTQLGDSRLVHVSTR